MEAVPDTPVTLPDPTEGWGPAWVVLESLARLADVRVADRVIEIVRENATDAWVSGARDAIANIARVEAALLGRRH